MNIFYCQRVKRTRPHEKQVYTVIFKAVSCETRRKTSFPQPYLIGWVKTVPFATTLSVAYSREYIFHGDNCFAFLWKLSPAYEPIDVCRCFELPCPDIDLLFQPISFDATSRLIYIICLHYFVDVQPNPYDGWMDGSINRSIGQAKVIGHRAMNRNGKWTNCIGGREKGLQNERTRERKKKGTDRVAATATALYCALWIESIGRLLVGDTLF